VKKRTFILLTLAFFLAFLMAQLVLVGGYVWLDGQHARLADVSPGVPPSFEYCYLMRTLQYPKFTRGNIFICNRIIYLHFNKPAPPVKQTPFPQT